MPDEPSGTDRAMELLVYGPLGLAAYLRDKEGKSHYDLKSDCGTIQKVSPDFKTHETVCTGIRFSVALRFNRHGDRTAAVYRYLVDPVDRPLFRRKGLDGRVSAAPRPRQVRWPLR